MNNTATNVTKTTFRQLHRAIIRFLICSQGTYRIIVQAPGFQKSVTDNVPLSGRTASTS